MKKDKMNVKYLWYQRVKTCSKDEGMTRRQGANLEEVPASEAGIKLETKFKYIYGL